MPSWTILTNNSWNNLQDKPAILSDEQISWNELIDKPFLSKTISGTTPSTASGFILLDLLDINLTTILSMSVLVDYSSNNSGKLIPSSTKSGYQFNWFISSAGQFRLELSGSSSSIYNKSFIVFILYSN
jgi:hypothetical protein